MMTEHVMTREEWLENRSRGIGASDIPTILGVNRWKSPYTLWAEKTGLIPPQQESVAMRVGHALEPLIAQMYEEATDRRVTDPGDYTVYSNPEFPFLFCTPDRIATFRDDETGPVELKHTGEFRGKDWWNDTDPPIDHVCQLQAQIAVLESEIGSVAGLIGNRKFLWFDVPRHDRLIKHIISKALEFWERIENNNPPPVDGSDSTAQTMKLLYPKDNGKTFTMKPLDVQRVLAYLEAQEAVKRAEEELAVHKNNLMAMMEYYTYAVSDDVSVSYKYQTRKNPIIVSDEYITALQQAKIPYIQHPPSEFRVLRVKAKGFKNE
jgi:putative phage-type endonuclease